MAIVAMFVLLRHGPSPQERIAISALSVAHDPGTRTNSTILVSTNSALDQALRDFLTTPVAYTETYREGDELTPGDGTATHRLYMRNEKDEFSTASGEGLDFEASVVVGSSTLDFPFRG